MKPIDLFCTWNGSFTHAGFCRPGVSRGEFRCGEAMFSLRGAPTLAESVWDPNIRGRYQMYLSDGKCRLSCGLGTASVPWSWRVGPPEPPPPVRAGRNHCYLTGRFWGEPDRRRPEAQRSPRKYQPPAFSLIFEFTLSLTLWTRSPAKRRKMPVSLEALGNSPKSYPTQWLSKNSRLESHLLLKSEDSK